MSWFRKEIEHNQIRPFGYGFAYHLDYKNIAVCYPIPLNWLIGWFMEITWYLARGPISMIHHEQSAMRQRAFREGYCEGYSDAKYGISSAYDNWKDKEAV